MTSCQSNLETERNESRDVHNGKGILNKHSFINKAKYNSRIIHVAVEIKITKSVECYLQVLHVIGIE